jgi:hypothetical protein
MGRAIGIADRGGDVERFGHAEPLSRAMRHARGEGGAWCIPPRHPGLEPGSRFLFGSSRRKAAGPRIKSGVTVRDYRRRELRATSPATSNTVICGSMLTAARRTIGDIRAPASTAQRHRLDVAGRPCCALRSDARQAHARETLRSAPARPSTRQRLGQRQPLQRILGSPSRAIRSIARSSAAISSPAKRIACPGAPFAIAASASISSASRSVSAARSTFALSASSPAREKRSIRQRERIVGSSRPGAWLTSRKIVDVGGSSRFLRRALAPVALQIVDRVDHASTRRGDRLGEVANIGCSVRT